MRYLLKLAFALSVPSGGFLKILIQGALGALSESECGLFPATPIFFKMEI